MIIRFLLYYYIQFLFPKSWLRDAVKGASSLTRRLFSSLCAGAWGVYLTVNSYSYLVLQFFKGCVEGLCFDDRKRIIISWRLKNNSTSAGLVAAAAAAATLSRQQVFFLLIPNKGNGRPLVYLGLRQIGSRWHYLSCRFILSLVELLFRYPRCLPTGIPLNFKWNPRGSITAADGLLTILNYTAHRQRVISTFLHRKIVSLVRMIDRVVCWPLVYCQS